MKKFKVAAVVGARPQFVKAAAIHTAWGRFPGRDKLAFVWVHTGQHYDYGLSEVFFKELRLPPPQYNLRVGSMPHGAQTALMLQKIEEVLLKERPRLVLVFGDTNSTLAGALAAVKLNIPVAHVEAGLRSFNTEMPEEINRVVTDKISTLLFCPTRDAVRQLEKEGIRKHVYWVGDVMADVLYFYKEKIDRLRPKGPYYLATIHRNVNTDDPSRLEEIFRALGALDKKVVVPLHPRTKNIIRRHARIQKAIRSSKRLSLLAPLPYLKMLALEKNALGIITDSGGVQKEAFWLGVPCVTLRKETEWKETTRSGLNTLCEPDAQEIMKAFTRMKRRKTAGKKFFSHNPRGQGNASWRILKLIARYSERSNVS